MAQGGVAHTDGHHTVSYRGTHALSREIGPYDYTPCLHRLTFIKTVLHAIVLKGEAQDNCMQDRLDERKAVDAWASVVGADLAAQCMRPVVRDGVMAVGVRNASLRQELTMNRSRLCRAINSAVGRVIIEDIRFTAPQTY